MAKVFVVGSSRSGTTLLNALLSASGRFASYRAETQLATLCRQKYGAVTGGRQLARFLAEWTTSRPFLRSGLSEEKFRELASRHLPDWYGLTDAFLTTVAEHQGLSGWVESTPGHVFHLVPLARRIPDALFVHMVRDGRSVAASRRRLGWTVITTPDPVQRLIYAGLSWSQSIRAAERASPALGGRILTLRYEDLVADPGPVIERLNGHLFPAETEGPLSVEHLARLGPGNTAFGQLGPGLDQAPKDRWRRELTPSEADLLTWYLAPELRRLGYLPGGARRPAARHWVLKPARQAYLASRTRLARHTYLGRLTRSIPEREE